MLCSEHHKQVDDQSKHYTVERLRQIKQKHKEWIASLGAKEPGPLRVVPDPSFPQSRFLKKFIGRLFSLPVPYPIDGYPASALVEWREKLGWERHRKFTKSGEPNLSPQAALERTTAEEPEGFQAGADQSGSK